MKVFKNLPESVQNRILKAAKIGNITETARKLYYEHPNLFKDETQVRTCIRLRRARHLKFHPEAKLRKRTRKLVQKTSTVKQPTMVKTSVRVVNDEIIIAGIPITFPGNKAKVAGIEIEW
jgi:hypothetical protein